MDKKIALIGQFATDWIRYSDYEFRYAENGELYITPTENATFTMYNPFNVADDLLLDILNLGQEVLKIPDQTAKVENEQIKRLVAIFVKKYGLLGFISASVYNHHIIGEEQVHLIENNHICREKKLPGDQYVNLFMPFAQAGDVVFKADKHGMYVAKREDSPQFFGKRPVVLDLVFSRFYAEQVQWLLSFAQMLITHLGQLDVYRNTSAYLTEQVTVMSGYFHAEKIGFTITQLDQTMIAWQFDSLKTALETIYAFAVTDKKTFVKRCEHCGKVFIGSTTREKYCCPACRNCANVQKSRNKKRLARKELSKNE